MVFLVYAGATVLALLLLYFFHAHWYWHAASVALALAVGLMPPHWIPVPVEWGSTRDMVIGGSFLFLMVWGLGAPLFRRHHTPHAPGAGA
jgi:hypothetical protein